MRRTLTLALLLAALLPACLPDGDGGSPASDAPADSAEDTPRADSGGCERDDQCARGLICDADRSACTAVACRFDDACRPSRICYQTTLTCTGVECIFDTDCAPDLACEGGLCVEPTPVECTKREDCAPRAMTCNTFTEKCVPQPDRCVNSTDCVWPMECEAGTGACR
jgi:hypothetical protein